MSDTPTLNSLLQGDPKKLLEKFLTDTPTGQKMVAEIDERNAQRRRELVAELEAADEELKIASLEESNRTQAAIAAKEEAHRLVMQANAEIEDSVTNFNRAHSKHRKVRAHVESELARIMDPRIMETLLWLQEQENEINRGRTSPIPTDAAQAAVQNTCRQRMATINAAIPVLQRLAYEPLDAAQIGERIAAIRESIKPELPGYAGHLAGTVAALPSSRADRVGQGW